MVMGYVAAGSAAVAEVPPLSPVAGAAPPEPAADAERSLPFPEAEVGADVLLSPRALPLPQAVRLRVAAKAATRIAVIRFPEVRALIPVVPFCGREQTDRAVVARFSVVVRGSGESVQNAAPPEALGGEELKAGSGEDRAKLAVGAVPGAVERIAQ